ncbi:MAG TPA: PfkB family carbohydrate kinase [Ktedonobacteraceae bacterium]|jgi:D-beta-D-heptose 7-phosphate kinase/D-beta-D-heptose 1-phosphate adenosyltransferase
MTKAHALIQHFANLHALVIGDAMLDSYLEGEADRLCREGPVPIVQKKSELHLPGGAANTAANLRALGAEVSFLSLIGQDSAGDCLRVELHKRGIHDQAVIASPTLSTLHKQRIIADGQYVVRVDAGKLLQDEEIEHQLQQNLLDALEKAYPICDVIVVSDYCHGVVCKALVARLCALQWVQPKILLLDSKHLENLRDLRATVVTPNYDEARQLVGGAISAEESKLHALSEVEQIGQQMLATLATEHVAVTLGAQGVFLMDRQGQTCHLPAYPVAHANDVGAGDSFASAMALTLAAGGSMEEAAHIGLEAACIAVTKPRTALVHYQELARRFMQREEVLGAAENKKQLSLADLCNVLEQARQNGQTMVFTNGVFDLLHFGHIRLLYQAKKLGNILVVGINSDHSARLLKGEGRPINNEYERLALVGALDAVDYVILFDEDTPERLIRALRPDIHVKGGNYADRALPEAEAVYESGGRVVIIPREDGKSTSSTIARITAIAREPNLQALPRVESQSGGVA